MTALTRWDLAGAPTGQVIEFCTCCASAFRDKRPRRANRKFVGRHWFQVVACSNPRPSPCPSKRLKLTHYLSYGYDQWANLTTIGAVSAYSGCTQENLSALANASNQLMASGFTYDTAGNMLSDGANSYTWNAEGEISSAAATDYTYDGDGNRLVKSSGKIYWYGGSSEVLAESGVSGTISDEYIYFGGRRVAHVVGGSAAYYYIQDFLGSSRVIINSQGSVCYDADFYPYGGERVVSDTCSSNYLFEGKERDPETGNDNFGARYYSSRLGRWLSADWSAIPEPVPYANLTNPQTLNLYAMVSDNPETFADLDGHHPPPAETGGTTPSPENKCLSSTLSSCDKTPPAQQQNNSQATTSSNHKSLGDHVFIKVASGLGIGADVKVGTVKVGAEVSAKSEGKHTLSGKAQVSTVKEAEASATIAGYGPALGYDNENTANYNKLTTGPPDGPVTQENHFGLIFKTPGGGSATFSSGSLSVEAGVCVVVCLSVGVGVQ